MSDWTTNTVGRELDTRERIFSDKTEDHIWLPDPSTGNEIRLHGCFLRREELTSKVDLYGLSEEDVVVFTSGGIVATGNKKILYPGDIADGATLGKIVPKFEVQKKTSVLKIKKDCEHEIIMKTDILFVHPNASKVIYQDLAKKNSAIEPPIWAGMLANSVRGNGFSPEILDAEVLGLNYESCAKVALEFKARVICFVVYGQQPSASSQNMEGAVATAELIKELSSNEFYCFRWRTCRSFASRDLGKGVLY